jgi:DNA-binding MarR family transcriptional regulator
LLILSLQIKSAIIDLEQFDIFNKVAKSDPMSKANSYLKFLEKLQAKKSSLSLTPTETKLLHAVAQAQDNGDILQVKDLLALGEIASQATLHGSLKKLVEKKLLTTKADKVDGRVKHVQLTKLGNKYFSDLSDALVMATKK